MAALDLVAFFWFWFGFGLPAQSSQGSEAWRLGGLQIRVEKGWKAVPKTGPLDGTHF